MRDAANCHGFILLYLRLGGLGVLGLGEGGWGSYTRKSNFCIYAAFNIILASNFHFLYKFHQLLTYNHGSNIPGSGDIVKMVFFFK